MDETWVPHDCTLPTAELPLRVAEFDSLLAAATRGVERVDVGRLRLKLDHSPDVAGQAARLAVKESKCCSFFTFTLTADGDGLQLEIAAPQARADVLDALMERTRS
jgi:hypothetical protein